jgi:hypothetical protein
MCTTFRNTIARVIIILLWRIVNSKEAVDSTCLSC